MNEANAAVYFPRRGDIIPSVNHEFPPLHDCWYLTGATASGKTAIGVALARALDAEIVSLDSMAVYRRMDIGTAKPSIEERGLVAHHLIDVVDPNEEFSLSEYLSLAHKAADDIRNRGRRALFVGGTPLYLKSLLRGVCEGPPSDPTFRAEVEAELDRVGLDALRERLEQVDPLAAAKLHPNDKRRMIRALEVYKQTGIPISHYQMHFDSQQGECKRVFILSWERSELHQRINDRVDDMFDQGLVDEVRGILTACKEFSKTSLQGVGYREVLDLLNGECELADAMERTKIRTRRFARRQETWFRGFPEGHWIAMTHASEVDEIVTQICEMDSK